MKTFLVLAVAGCILGGAALAGLTRRIHESISFAKNWAYFSVLLALIVAVVFGIVLH